MSVLQSIQFIAFRLIFTDSTVQGARKYGLNAAGSSISIRRVFVASLTHGFIVEVEVQQVCVLDLCHLDDRLVVHPLLVGLDLGPHQLVPLVRVEPGPHGKLHRS